MRQYNDMIMVGMGFEQNIYCMNCRIKCRFDGRGVQEKMVCRMKRKCEPRPTQKMTKKKTPRIDRHYT